MTHLASALTTRSTSLRRAMLAMSGATSIALAGCAGGVPAGSAAATFDPQTCAENALRHHPDASLAREAVETFAAQCAARDAAACSMLGVTYELGIGVERDRVRARGLYRHACDGGNVRACGNLGELLLADLEPGANPGAAKGLLEGACTAGQARACAALGRAFRQGRVMPREPATAAVLFEHACARGEAAACVEAAELIESGAVSGDPAHAAELVALACARGSEEGCARMTTPRPGRGLLARGGE